MSGPPARALVIQTAFLGDVVLTTALLSALAERHGPVDVVTTAAAAPLLETHPAVARVIPYDKHGRDRGAGGVRRMARGLARASYKVAYLPHRSLRSAVLARLAGVPRRVGFRGGWSFLYTDTRSRPASGPERDRLLALADAPPGSFAPRLYPSDEDKAAVEAFLRAAGLSGEFIALAPGSIWGSKRWPYYADLATHLAPGAAIVAVGGPEDGALGDAIVKAVGRSGGRAVSAAGALSLRQSVALIGRARLLVANDSAPVHFASAMGTPVVALFGPTIPEFGFGPLGPTDVALGVAGLPCRPCSSHGPRRCPLGHHRCMKDLSVETVLNEIERTRALHRRH